MAKVKIHELAKELGLASKEIVNIINDSGLAVVKGHSSSIEEELVEKIKNKLKSDAGLGDEFNAIEDNVEKAPTGIVKKGIVSKKKGIISKKNTSDEVANDVWGSGTQKKRVIRRSGVLKTKIDRGAAELRAKHKEEEIKAPVLEEKEIAKVEEKPVEPKIELKPNVVEKKLNSGVRVVSAANPTMQNDSARFQMGRQAEVKKSKPKTSQSLSGMDAVRYTKKIKQLDVKVEIKEEKPTTKEDILLVQEENITKKFETTTVVAPKHSKTFGTPEYDGPGKSKKKRKKKKKVEEVNKVAIKDKVKATMSSLNVADVGGKKRYKKNDAGELKEDDSKQILEIGEFIAVAELANLMNIKSTEIIQICFGLGLMVSINQRLDFETAKLVTEESEFEVVLTEEYEDDALELEHDDNEEDLEPRHPIVTVMGHVDHGKTSLLDYIRKSNVVAGESGGITQHVDAYMVTTDKGNITFLDTPGHEAFSSMRARGANVTDLIIIIVAADANEIMPQTVESINHAKSSGVPYIIALNKVDLPNSDPARIKGLLTNHDVVVEELGGSIGCIEISCKTGKNIDVLLDSLFLEAEMLELKANPNCKASGTVVEAALDKGKGPVATVIISRGTLKQGDAFLIGSYFGKVRMMLNERGDRLKIVKPSDPVRITGISGIPQSGDSFVVLENEKAAREISEKRLQSQKTREIYKGKVASLEDVFDKIQENKTDNLNVIIKGDVDGSVEALSTSLQTCSTEEVAVNVVHKSVGAINESDIYLAASSEALIIAFHVYPNGRIRELAEKEGVEIRNYKVIYETIDDIKKALIGMLKADEKEVILGSAEVRNTFKISSIGTIAGCMVTSGVIKRGARIRLLRSSIEVVDTTINVLKRFKDDVKEVKNNFECGILLKDFNDLKDGDIIEAYEVQQIARTAL